MRAAWLSSLEDELEGARVLDLFAGTGALGLEALSRGADSVDFVENGAPALHALKANVATLRAKKRTRLFKKDVFEFLPGIPAGPEPPYAVAFADPPYTSRAAERLATLWLKDPFSAILSIEHDAQCRLPGKAARRRFEDSALTIYRR